MLLVDIHELDIILAETVGLGALEHEVDGIGRVIRLERQDVFVLGGAQHLGQGDQVDTQGDVAVAPVGREPLCLQQHRHQRHVRVVHGLEGDPRVIAVEVAILNQVLDGVDDLYIPIETVSSGRVRLLLAGIRGWDVRASEGWLVRGGLPTLVRLLDIGPIL